MRLSTLHVTVCLQFLFVKIFDTDATKILGISWYPAISHQATFNPIWKELSLRGHQVTIITPVPIKDNTLKNLTEIDVSFLFETRDTHNSKELFSKDRYTWQLVMTVKYYLLDIFDLLLASNEVQELIQNEENFDIIVAEPHSPLIFAFGERFKAPVVGLCSMTVPNEMYDLYANPTHPLISPDYTMPVDTSPNDHPFSLRVRSFLYNIWERMLYNWYFLPESDKIAKKYFGASFPYLGDICRKYASILLTNVNILTNPIRANVPSVIEINQIHIRKNLSLPKDLQIFLDNSSNGAVYFSLGTHILSTQLNNKTLSEIIQAFSELPFNILMKWDGETLPRTPSNILARRWFPQQEVLAHPNTKIFVTQGGVQSIEEAVSTGVPMVGIPFLADQPLNIKRLVDLGLAVRLQYSDITKESLKHAITEVAENKRYKETIEKYKAIMEDQPMKGVDKAVWWIEYVIRHKGAEHLRSPAVDISYYKYFMLDVILFLLAVMIFTCLCFYQFLSVLKRCKSKLKPKKD